MTGNELHNCDRKLIHNCDRKLIHNCDRKWNQPYLKFGDGEWWWTKPLKSK